MFVEMSGDSLAGLDLGESGVLRILGASVHTRYPAPESETREQR